MSAAAHLSADEAPLQKPPRPTGPSLVKRLLTKPGLAARLEDLEVVPYGGRQVLGAVAKPVATEGDGEFCPVHPTLSPGGLARKVVSTLRYTNSAAAEAQTNGLLQALATAELIELEPGGVRLPLPPLPPDGFVAGPSGSVVDFAKAGRLPPVRIGAPRKGESPAEYAARQAAVRAQREREFRAAASGQRSLALPPTLVGPTSDKSAIYGSRTSDSHENKSELSADLPEGTSVSPTSPPRAEDEDDSEISISESSSSSSPEVRAHVSDLSENKSADISSQEVDLPDLSPEALELAAQISRVLGFGPDQAAQAPRAVQNWLLRWPKAAALIPQALEKCFAQNEAKRLDGQKPIRTVGYVRTVLQQLAEAAPDPDFRDPAQPAAVTAPSPGVRWSPDPRVLEHPAWATAPPAVQRDIARVLDAMAEPKPGERMRRLSSCHKVRHEAFVLVAARHPNLYEDAGKEPPADLDVRENQRPTAPA